MSHNVYICKWELNTLSSSCRFMRMEDGNAHEYVYNCKALDGVLYITQRTILLSFYTVRNKLLNSELLSEIMIIPFKNAIFHLYLLSHIPF